MAVPVPVRNGLQRGLALVLLALLIAGLQRWVAADPYAGRTVSWYIPSAEYRDMPLERDFIDVEDAPSLGLNGRQKMLILRHNGAVIMVAVPVTTQGYRGPINLVVSITPEGVVRKTDVISQQETPGIGDRALANSSWLRNFSMHSLQNPTPERWQLRSDGGEFDAVTGATVTSRAATAAVRRALDYFAAHRERLLRPAAEHSP